MCVEETPDIAFSGSGALEGTFSEIRDEPSMHMRDMAPERATQGTPKSMAPCCIFYLPLILGTAGHCLNFIFRQY